MSGRTIDFDFQNTSQLANADDFSRFNFFLPLSTVPSRDGLCLFNGENENSIILRAVDTYSQLALTNLIVPQPVLVAEASVSWPGNGRIYGRGYLWAYRFRSSKTGQVSGLSPISKVPTDLGVETTPGSNTYFGQNARFLLLANGQYGAAASAFMDIIDIFRNTSDQQDVFFRVTSIAWGSDTFVQFLDDLLDEEIVGNETAGLDINPRYEEGPVPAFAKAFSHPTGRLALYGVRSMGVVNAGLATVTQGSRDVVLNSALSPTAALVGLKLRFTNTDTTDYRIVSAVSNISGRSLFVEPPIVGASGSNQQYEIIDDRDTRTVQFTEPNKPMNCDPLKQVFIGFDKSDDLLHLFSMSGSTYAQTRRHLYRLANDFSADPSLTMIVQEVAPEGCVGFEAGCITPMGWVYVHPSKGVRVFDGASMPRPLGADSAIDEFPPQTQFEGVGTDAYDAVTGIFTTGFEPSLISETVVRYDPATNLVHVFYVPTDSWAMSEELCFDPETGSWRGPWRRRCSSSMSIRNSGGDEVVAFGDDFGNVYLDQQQVYDMNGSPTVKTSDSGTAYALTDAAGDFDATTRRQCGVPFVMTLATGSSTYPLRVSFVADVISSTEVVLEDSVIDASSTWTYYSGAIRWLAQTAFFDFGEPVQPKTFEQVRHRFERGESTSTTVSVGVLLDGQSSTTAITGEEGAIFTFDTANTAFNKSRVRRQSTLFALAWYGTSTVGDPQVTNVLADIEVEGGNIQ